MADHLTLTWQGREYEVARREAAEPGSGDTPVWQVTRDGAPVTSFPAQPGDGAGAVRRKVVEWLEGNESRPTLDIGRQ